MEILLKARTGSNQTSQLERKSRDLAVISHSLVIGKYSADSITIFMVPLI